MGGTAFSKTEVGFLAWGEPMAPVYGEPCTLGALDESGDYVEGTAL